MCANVQKCIPMQTAIKISVLSDSFQCKPEIAFFKVIFLIQMMSLGILYERDKIKISKMAV